MLLNFIITAFFISSPIFVGNIIEGYRKNMNKKSIILIAITIIAELIFIFTCSNYLTNVYMKYELLKTIFAILHILQFVLFFGFIKVFKKCFSNNSAFLKLLGCEVVVFIFFLAYFIKQDPVNMLYVLYFSLPSVLVALVTYTYINLKSK